MLKSTKAIGLTIVSAFILSACAEIANSPQKNTIQGVGVGAGTGALAGIILGDTKRDVVIGTAAGAVIGGIVGSQLDQ
jgi:uncharacterized membrane protein YjjB (DUF3815 family)